MEIMVVAVIAIILAFVFTFTNGFQDASAIAATFIASRSASPQQGILLVAAMDFLGALFGGSAVAFTISGLLIMDPGIQFVDVILVAVLSATAWNIITWKFGLPSSSTHALIGGLIGAAVAAAGIGSIYWGWEELISSPHQLTGIVKILFFLGFSIILGLVGGFLMRKISRVALRNKSRSVNKKIVRINWIAAAIMAFTNGANDSQKQLGIIALVLVAAGQTAILDVPLWARIICAIMLGAGTLAGGWRIMTTLGQRIFKIQPIHSFDSQISSGATIGFSSLAGAPVSSSHIISTSVIGVGYSYPPTIAL